MSPNVRKRDFEQVQPTKIQISLCIHAVWSENSLGAFWRAKDTKFLYAEDEDPDQTARMRRLIGVLEGCIYQKVRFLTLRIKCNNGPQEPLRIDIER